MICVIDCATTGLIDWRANPQAPHQPHIVRVAMTYVDPSTYAIVPEETMVWIVAPPVDIDKAGTDMHGIDERNLSMSVNCPSIDALLQAFGERLEAAEVVTGYSVDFHRRVLERAAAFIGGEITWPAQKVCIMRAAAPVVQVGKGKNGAWMWPRFDDAVPILLGHEAPQPTGRPYEDGKDRVETVGAMYAALMKRGEVK